MNEGRERRRKGERGRNQTERKRSLSFNDSITLNLQAAAM